MLAGETIVSGASPKCDECKTSLKLEIMKSGAGFYIGTQCLCGPYSRESRYFKSREVAEQALADLRPEHLRKEGFTG